MATATAPRLYTAVMPAALGEELVGLGALPEPEPEPEAPEEAAGEGTDAVPEGALKSVMEPVKGPGAAEAAAPEPLRAPVGIPGTALAFAARACAALWKAVKLAVGTLMPL